jgi:membrane-associated protease RseP (regulator of RpoE activity)
LFLEAGAMKTIAVTLLTALCWLVAREAVWGQSALQRLEEMIRQPKAASGTAPAKPPESPAPPKAAATQPAPSPEPGYLGVLADDKDDRGRGVRVLKVTPGGPADQAGLKPQDLITRLGGVPIRQMSELTAILQQMSAGATLSFEVLRGDRKQELSVVFGRRPPDQRRLPPKEQRAEAPPLSAAGPPPAAPALEVPPVEGPVIPGAVPGVAAPAANPPAAVARDEIDRLLRRIEQLEKRVEQLERGSPEKK